MSRNARTLRTTRSIAVVALAGAACLVATVPAHAADVTEYHSVEATWEFAGVLPDAPGNVHTGQVLVRSGDRSTVFVSVTDWQCPDGVTSPSDDICTVVRTGNALAEDAGEADIAFMTDRKLMKASVMATLPGGWSVDGE